MRIGFQPKLIKLIAYQNPGLTSRFGSPSMLLAIIILVLLSALVATDPDTPGGGRS